MDRSTHRRFHSHLEDRLGDALRSIVYYDAETQRVVYLRDDAREAIASEQAERLIEYLREREGIQGARERLGLDAGLQCTLHCWPDRVGLHFPQGPRSGTLVTADTTVASDLLDFVSDCREIAD